MTQVKHPLIAEEEEEHPLIAEEEEEEEEETLPNREAERRQRSKRGHLKIKRGEGEEEMRASGGRGSREDVGARRLGIVASVRASATR